MKTIKETFKSIKLPSCQVVNKEEEILKQCTHKKVLHLGCVDYPLTIERIKKNQFLHLKIMKVAREVMGVDVSHSGIRYLKTHLEIDNIIYGDVQNLSTLNLPKDFDTIVVGELLEHLSNPGLFLEGLRDICFSNTIVLITVPNAFSIKSFLRILTKRELVHPDHIAYYSPRTVSSLVQRFGFEIISIKSYLAISASKIKRFLQIILHWTIKNFFPYTADGLIFIIKVKNEKNNE
ncbi:class I SAM-dependent methyltransferase [Thermodesulfovibrionales bacterium]|nr:class I SAM-dependent methyltransferase [Thermodesulfovibrionales bacterium]